MADTFCVEQCAFARSCAVEPEPERRERLIQEVGERDSGAIHAVAHSLDECVEGKRFGKKRRVRLLLVREDIVGIARDIQDPEARMPRMAVSYSPKAE